jgi:hypothetical protein
MFFFIESMDSPQAQRAPVSAAVAARETKLPGDDGHGDAKAAEQIASGCKQ